jgi:hypothetical protein
MNETTTVSAKISKKMRQDLEKYHVQVSEVIRAALEEEICRKEEEQLAERLDHAKTILNKVPKGMVTDIIRSDRESR